MTTPYTEADFVETNFILGSGYGWALAETDRRSVIAVLLINEEGEPLVELAKISVDNQYLNRYLDSVTKAIVDGHGAKLLANPETEPEDHS